MLVIKHLTKRYGTLTAVDDLSLTVEKGDIYGFIGANGAGKTTTLKSIAGILPFEEGTITIDGKSILETPISCKKEMAYIPDNPDLYDYITGSQYLNFIADLYGVNAAEREERIRQYGDAFEITSRLGDLIGACSHGMKQKIAIIGALLHKPRLLLLDEPFVGLDPKAAHILKEDMHALCKEGCAIFFSTHVLEVAEKLCNKIAVIKDGRLVASGEMEAVKGDGSLEELFLELTDHA